MLEYMTWPLQLSEHLFWDVKRDELDPEKQLKWLLARVVGYGTLNDWKILCQNIEIETIKKEAVNIRTLKKIDLNFLSKVLNIPLEKFRCYTQTQSLNQHWNY